MFPSQNFLLLFGHIHLLESDGKLEFYLAAIILLSKNIPYMLSHAKISY